MLFSAELKPLEPLSRQRCPEGLTTEPRNRWEAAGTTMLVAASANIVVLAGNKAHHYCVCMNVKNNLTKAQTQ